MLITILNYHCTKYVCIDSDVVPKYTFLTNYQKYMTFLELFVGS